MNHMNPSSMSRSKRRRGELRNRRADAARGRVQHRDLPNPADAPLQLDIFKQARRQIAEAKTVEPVNHIIALATGLAAAARKATNRDLEAKAEVLKMEAQRKLGQLMAAQKETARAYRPDLARGRSARETLDLRREPKLAGEITMRFVERNIAILRQRGLPATAGTLYLSHFAGGGGAVAILSAPDNSDAPLVIASADSTGRTKRDRLIGQPISRALYGR